MFGLGKKKKEDVYAAVTGVLIPLTEVSDPVLAQKMMGDGFAIKPKNGEIYAPVDGNITMIFPTKHAISIKTVQGLEVLVHMGFDTVEMDGRPFDVRISRNQKVKAGDLLANMNLKLVADSDHDTMIAVVYTNMALLKSFPEISAKNVTAKEMIGELNYK
ncbi:PTS sugar transporter subunit IIA [Lacticaseibacillus paracasei]|uniref:PTS sugar transporter subunit IIA n=1 Tax=Lacticaseibacillus paracasei TaxID=1597 RepID=UPI0005EB1F6A|nr:PTS glucose transporter subunit IIA [Lacticaseibacillus paracasei]